jgi:alanine-synthesizing transaminase
MNALLDAGDEVLIPAPDYPLYTAVTVPVRRHARCTTAATRGAGWLPDIDDIRASITPRTKAIVVINPNNPTGALYPTRHAAAGDRRDRAQHS